MTLELVTLDLEWDDSQQAVAAALDQYANDRWDDDAVKASISGDPPPFPDALWRDLAELGVWAVMTPEGDGGAMEAVAALEVLGRRGLPGPIADTFVATQLLDDDECRAVAAGETVAVVLAGEWLPWPERAGIAIAADRSGALRRVELAGAFGPAERTLGSEPWARIAVEPGAPFERSERGRSAGGLALATLMAAAAAELVDRAAEHARSRSQFGRSIGEFQAVAHPLAEVHVRQTTAACLCRAAAFALDENAADGAPRAGAARASARVAALEAVHTVHQLFGAVGITLEGPVFHLSRRIRQWASHPLPVFPGAVLEWMLDGGALLGPAEGGSA